MTKILIVGGVAGGASAAARARRLSEDAEIIIFERGPFVSFANCGLPYHIGGDIKDRSKLLLQTPDSFLQRFNVDVRVQNEVIDIDRKNKIVTIKNLAENIRYTESYDFLILSPGAAPIVPPIEGIENPLTHSLRNIPDMDKILNSIAINRPKHATVVGGGFIGLEMMEALHQLDISVTLLEFAPQVMMPVDAEMAGAVHQTIRDHGVDLRLSTGLTGVKFTAGAQAECGSLDLTLSDNTTLTTELLIMAIGVRPETTLAKAAGLTLGPLGGIKVDAQMRTNDQAILAVGDAVEDVDFVTGEQAFVPLAGPANRQGRLAADVIFGSDETYRGTQGTAICKVFELAVAATGKNEKYLKQADINYEKAYVHSASHAGYYPGAEMVSLKLLFSPTDGTIFGAQAFGKAGIDKRIDILAVAQRAGMKVQDLQHLELTYAPPYGAAKDVVNQAAFVATNIMKGDVTPIHFDEVNNLTDHQTLLDVRNPGELEKLGSIESAINIPVDELRSRMGELPKDKEIVVYCQVGLRGNVAYRQLANNGFKVKNLVGGYRTWLLAQQ